MGPVWAHRAGALGVGGEHGQETKELGSKGCLQVPWLSTGRAASQADGVGDIKYQRTSDHWEGS